MFFFFVVLFVTLFVSNISIYILNKGYRNCQELIKECQASGPINEPLIHTAKPYLYEIVVLIFLFLNVINELFNSGINEEIHIIVGLIVFGILDIGWILAVITDRNCLIKINPVFFGDSLANKVKIQRTKYFLIGAFSMLILYISLNIFFGHSINYFSLLCFVTILIYICARDVYDIYLMRKVHKMDKGEKIFDSDHQQIERN